MEPLIVDPQVGWDNVGLGFKDKLKVWLGLSFKDLLEN